MFTYIHTYSHLREESWPVLRGKLGLGLGTRRRRVLGAWPVQVEEVRRVSSFRAFRELTRFPAPQRAFSMPTKHTWPLVQNWRHSRRDSSLNCTLAPSE